MTLESKQNAVFDLKFVSEHVEGINVIQISTFVPNIYLLSILIINSIVSKYMYTNLINLIVNAIYDFASEMIKQVIFLSHYFLQYIACSR